MVEPTMDNTYGSLLLGLVLSAVLYGVTVLQTFLYFRNYPRDRIILKAMVAFLWFLDTCHLVLCTIAVYWYLVTNFSNIAAGSQLTWSMELQTDFNGLIGLIVECFFAHRVWILSKNPYLTVVIVILASVHFGLGIVFTVASFRLTSATQLNGLIWVTGAGLGSGAAADVLIAGSLCYYLSKTRTGFQKTDSIITALILWSVTTGLITSILDLVVIVTFSTVTDTWVWEAIFFVAGKFYVNSLLASLNCRETLRGSIGRRHGSEFLQFTPTGNMSDLHSSYANRMQAPTPLTVAIQRDTVYQTDYPNGSSPLSTISSPISKMVSVKNDFEHTV